MSERNKELQSRCDINKRHQIEVLLDPNALKKTKNASAEPRRLFNTLSFFSVSAAPLETKRKPSTRTKS